MLPKPTFVMDDRVSGDKLAEITEDAKVQRCLWHKRQNISKRLAGRRYRTAAVREIKKILYASSEAQFKRKWDAFKENFPAEVNMVKEYVEQRDSEFVKYQRDKNMNLGFYDSSAAESMNNSIDSYNLFTDDGTLSLVQYFFAIIRHNRSMRAKEQREADENATNILQKKLRLGKNVFLKEAARLNSNWAVERLKTQFSVIDNYQVEYHVDKKFDGYVVRHRTDLGDGEKPVERTVTVCNVALDGYDPGWQCSCHEDTAYRIVCRHILKVLDHENQLNYSDKMLADRWKRTFALPVEMNYSELTSDVESNVESNVDSKDDSDFDIDVDENEDHEDHDGELLVGDLDGGVADGIDPRKRYLNLRAKFDNMCAHAAKTMALYTVVDALAELVRDTLSGMDSSGAQLKSALRLTSNTLLSLAAERKEKKREDDGDTVLGSLSQPAQNVSVPRTVQRSGRKPGRYKSSMCINVKKRNRQCSACGISGHTKRSRECPKHFENAVEADSLDVL
eukprot:jgi/Bigna1/139056/aug1.48_g13764